MKAHILDDFIEKANLVVGENERISRDYLDRNPDSSIKLGMAAWGSREAADKVIELLRAHPDVDDVDFFIKPVEELFKTVDLILKGDHGYDDFGLLCALGVRRGYHDILSMWDTFFAGDKRSLTFIH